MKSGWWRRVVWALTFLLGVWVLLWAGVSAWAQWQLPTQLEKRLGRHVSLQQAWFLPWRLELRLTGLVIDGASGADGPLLEVAQLRINASLSSVWRRALVLDAVEVDEPKVALARTHGGHYNIDDLWQRLQPEPQHDQATPSEAVRFAVYGLRVHGGQLRLNDQPAQQLHTVHDIDLSWPLVSNLPGHVEQPTEPVLRFQVGSTVFDSRAQAMPFKAHPSGGLQIHITNLDVTPYAGYWPSVVPMRLVQGRVSTQLSLTFQTEPSALGVQGWLQVQDGQLQDRAGKALLAWDHIKLVAHDVQPLAHKLVLASLEMHGLQAQVQRDARGQLNWQSLWANDDARPANTSPGPAWQVGLDHFVLDNAQVHWHDQAVQPAARLALAHITVQAEKLHWPPATLATTTQWHAELQTEDEPAQPLGRVDAQVQVDASSWNLTLGLDQLALHAAQPYLSAWMVPTVHGQLSVQAQLQGSHGTDVSVHRVHVEEARVQNLRLDEGAKSVTTMEQWLVAKAEVDVPTRRVTLGQVRFDKPTLHLQRDARGQINVRRWWRSSPDSNKAQAHHAEDRAQPAWQVQLQDVALEGLHLVWLDARLPTANFELTEGHVQTQQLQWHGHKAMGPTPWRIHAKLTARGAESSAPGSLDFNGQIGLQPWTLTGALRLVRLPVHVAAPYAMQDLKLHLDRAYASYDGRLSVQPQAGAWATQAAGRVQLADVLVTQKNASIAHDRVLSWKTLNLDGFKLAWQPHQRPEFEVDKARLDIFYASFMINPDGRFNLQDVSTVPAAAAPASAVSAAEPATNQAATTPDFVGPMPTDLGFHFQLGEAQISRGKIDFVDRFIRPNYSATLTELSGRMGTLSSRSRAMAPLQLQGKVAGTAKLSVQGQLNPLVKPPALDISAQATDLDLVPFSPYAGKYAGYAIEQGQLNMDVSYKIAHDGQLQASNQIVLKRLTFGEKIESKDATKLPVRLLLALLKDRHGTIDVNLPIHGSINDPQFSMGRVIVKVVLNLLGKVITSPFAWMSGGSHDDERGVVAYQSGTANLTPEGQRSLDKIAKMLIDRPQLKVTLTGHFDPQAETEALAQAWVQTQLQALRPSTKRTAQALTEAEQASLLRQLYRQTKLPNKPRNALGLSKDLSVNDMQARLQEKAPVSQEAMQTLAQQRATQVREALLAKGLPNERIHVAEPKVQSLQGVQPTMGVALSVQAD